MKTVYFCDFLLLGFIIAVVGKIMMTLSYADCRIRPVVSVMRYDVRGYSGGIGLECQRQQVEHQVDMLLAILRNALRFGEI
jgi:hypothetical protein